MPRLHWLGWLLWLLLSGCGQQTITLPPLEAEDVVLTFGDSLTFGTGAKPFESYPSVLAELINRRVINAGLPGEESGPGLQRLRHTLEQTSPDLLVLCHGGNDLLRKRPKERLSANLEAMIELAQGRGIPVVLIGVPEPKLLFLSAAPLYAEVASSTGVPYEAGILAEVESDSSLKSDQIHPNAEGYQRMAAAVARLLKDHGAL